MPSNPPFALVRDFDLPVELGETLAEAALSCLNDRRKAFRLARRPRKGAALHSGKDTPLWNALVAAIRPHLRRHGAQAALSRRLGLDRQTIHAYFVARTRMPDAERTLQLLTWLIAVGKGAPPA